MELDGSAGVDDGAGIDFGERVGIDAKHFLVAVVGRARREAEGTLRVEEPAGNLLCVLAQEGFCAGGEVEFVEVVPGFVAIIEADVEGGGVGLGDAIEIDAHTFEAGEIAQGRSFGIGGVRGGGVDGIDVEVFIAGVVFYEHDRLGVARPEEGGDGAGGFSGEDAGGGEGLACFLDPDIAGAFPGFQESKKFAIGRDAGGGDFRVAEEDFAIN